MTIAQLAIIISFFSICIAGLSLGWNIYRDIILKPRVEISFGIRTLIQTGQQSTSSPEYITFIATNFGPGTVTLSMIQVKLSSLWRRIIKKEKFAIVLEDKTNPLSAPLPAKMEIGGRVNFLLPYDKDCLLKEKWTHVGISDYFGKVHWASKKQIKQAVKKWQDDFSSSNKKKMKNIINYAIAIISALIIFITIKSLIFNLSEPKAIETFVLVIGLGIVSIIISLLVSKVNKSNALSFILGIVALISFCWLIINYTVILKEKTNEDFVVLSYFHNKKTGYLIGRYGKERNLPFASYDSRNGTGWFIQEYFKQNPEIRESIIEKKGNNDAIDNSSKIFFKLTERVVINFLCTRYHDEWLFEPEVIELPWGTSTAMKPLEHKNIGNKVVNTKKMSEYYNTNPFKEIKMFYDVITVPENTDVSFDNINDTQSRILFTNKKYFFIEMNISYRQGFICNKNNFPILKKYITDEEILNKEWWCNTYVVKINSKFHRNYMGNKKMKYFLIWESDLIKNMKKELDIRNIFSVLGWEKRKEF